MAWQRYDALYKPGQKTAFKMSRSKIDLFIECPRCFWLDRRLGIKRPDTPPFQINKAIDELLKKEFDIHRSKKTAHPFMKDAGFDGVPFAHDKLDQWRDNFTGVQFSHPSTSLLVFGAVDDIWIDKNNALAVVDYKATSKNKDITDLDPPGSWHDSYRRQMEVYQWLLRRNDFTVSDTGYFVYANAQTSEKEFANKIVFVTRTFSYTGNDSWIEPTLHKLKDCLDGDIPAIGDGYMGHGCQYCAYARSRTELTLKALQKRK